MSGDVQPRKRKDKKKKKDELSGGDELRGTAATFGEGDVLIHSQHEHGTGGHWCAKIIFFSLLAVLVALIGLIILENRGLSELEANSVESRYAGVLDGWLEDAPDDHHDPHTLELNHPEEDEHDELEGSDEGEEDVELEDIEQEPDDSAAVSGEHYSAPSEENDDEPGDDGGDEGGDDDGSEEDGAEQSDEDVPEAMSDDDADEDDFLQQDDDDDGVEQSDDDGVEDGGDDNQDENVSTPASLEAPYEEMEDSTEQLPADSLLEEEEYEKEQEQQRQQAEAEGHEGGENAMINEDEWPDEPSEEHWRRELDLAEDEMNRGLLD